MTDKKTGYPKDSKTVLCCNCGEPFETGINSTSSLCSTCKGKRIAAGILSRKQRRGTKREG